MTSQERKARRIAELSGGIRTRLASICAEWPAKMFDQLVERIAETTYKFERHGSLELSDEERPHTVFMTDKPLQREDS